MHVANAIANGLLQHPEQPQESQSISSDTKAFFRAQGPQVTLELPLLTDRETAERSLVVPRIGNQRFDNDFFDKGPCR